MTTNIKSPIAVDGNLDVTGIVSISNPVSVSLTFRTTSISANTGQITFNNTIIQKASITSGATGIISIDNPVGAVPAFNVVGWQNSTLGQTTSTEFDNGTAGATKTISWLVNGIFQKVTLTTATTCTLTFTAPPSPCWIILRTISPAAGTVPAIVWPASVKWAAATKPAQATTLGRSNVQRFYFDGTNYWGDAILNAA